MAAKVTFTGVDKLAESIAAHDRKVKRVILGQFLRGKDEALAFAKLNAPWTDRTGNARSGLNSDAYPINGGEAFELVMAHSMFYGIYLEARFSGKFAILMPTINYIGAVMMDRIAQSINRIDVS